MPSFNSIGTPFIELPTIDSTNNYAIGLIQEGHGQHGTAIFAHEQTSGKGQRNKIWISPKDHCIALSIILKPEGLLLSQQFQLSMAIAIGTFRFIKKYTGKELSIKWPNDIYWRDRKAGGILIENLVSGRNWKFSVVGIGINVNQDSFEGINNAISLKQITGKKFDPLKLAKKLCDELNVQFGRLVNKNRNFTKEYKSHLYQMDSITRLKSGNLIFDGFIKDVTEEGKLVVEYNGKKIFSVGEVEWIIGINH